LKGKQFFVKGKQRVLKGRRAIRSSEKRRCLRPGGAARSVCQNDATASSLACKQRRVLLA